MTAALFFLSRRTRRARVTRAERMASFARVWRRALPLGAVLAVGILPVGTASARSLAPGMPGARRLASAVSQAAPNAYYQTTATDGNYSTPGNFKDAPNGGNAVVPDGAGGTFYMVNNTTGQAITHDHSTGSNGVDTLFGLSTNGSFYLTGGTLSGDQAGRSFAVSGTGSVFQISGGATLRSFAVTGMPLTVGSGSATLDNVTTNINGTVQGALTFANNTLATVASGDTLRLGIYNEGTRSLLGSGTLALAGGSLSVGQFDTGVIGSGVTVSGTGAVQGDTTSAGLVNNGTVRASGGTLTVQNLGGVTNNSLMQAASGAILAITSNTTNLGTINAASGGTVNLSNMSLTGNSTDGMGIVTTGLLSSAGTGAFNLTQDNLTNVTTSANVNVVNGRSNAFGTLTNTGTITVGTGNTLALGVYNEGAISLAGVGTVSLSGGSLNVGQFDTGTIGAGQTVSGTGFVQGDTTSGSLVNNGTIQAAGSTLTVQNLGSLTNNSLLEAISGGTLNLNSNLIGSLSVDNTSQFNINGVTVTNGTFGSIGTGGTFTLHGATLTDDTNAANLDLTSQDAANMNAPNGSAIVFNSLTFTNNGTATVGGGNTLTLGKYNEGTISLLGTGSVNLGTASGAGILAVDQFDTGIIGAGVTVSGVGSVQGNTTSAGLVNNGTVRASGGTLTVQNLGGVTNNSLMQAASGSTLALASPILNLGTINAANGGTVSINSTNFTGSNTDGMGVTTTGALTSTGTGAINFSQDNLINVTTSAQVNVVGGRSNAFGTLTNTGVIGVGTGNTLGLGSYNEGLINLAGAGTVSLTGGSLSVGQFDTGVVGAGVTVSGTGFVQGDTTSAGLANNGTVRAVGGTLTAQNFGGITNNSLMQAASGAILAITSNTTNLGTINAASGGIVNFSSMNLTGSSMDSMGVTTTGALTSTGTGTVNFNQDNLTNVSTSAQANIVGGRSNAFGTLTNTGTITVSTDNTLGLGSYNEGAINVAGAGTLLLTGGSLNVGQFDVGTIGAGQTVTGTGFVQGDTTSAGLTNNGTIQASGGTLTEQTLPGFTSNGALKAVGGGTLNITDATSGSGTISTDSTSAINFNGGSSLDQQGGTSQVDGAVTLGGTFTLSSGTLKGSGTVNGNVVNNGGTVKPGDSPGTLTLTGTYSQTSPGTLLIEFNQTSHSLLAVGGRATTGGTVNFSFLDSTVGAGVVGQTFDFLTSAGVGTSLPSRLFFANETSDPSGQSNGFVTETGPGGGLYRISRDPANTNALQVLVLAVVPAPEPSQFAALGVGVLSLGALALRARKRSAA